MTGPVPGDVYDPKRTHLVAFGQPPVDRAWRVPRASKREPNPERVRGEGAARAQANRLRQAGAFNDVGLPLVGVDQRAAEAFERRQAAEVRAVGVRERDVLEI